MHKRIVVRNAVSSVLADGARRRVLVQVRDDPQNLSRPACRAAADSGESTVRDFAGAAVAACPMYITRHSGSPRRAVGLKVDLAHRMDARVQLHPHQSRAPCLRTWRSTMFVSVHSISTASCNTRPRRGDRRRSSCSRRPSTREDSALSGRFERASAGFSMWTV